VALFFYILCGHVLQIRANVCAYLRDRVIREKQGLLQKEVASHINVDKSTYSKIEKGTREVTVAELQKLTKLFNLTTDEILNYDENIIPKEVVIEDKTVIEQMQLLEQLDEEDKSMVFKMIDKMLTNKKFKDFFAKNVATL
jgi:transcriptional regulator with XRE-family HTH domain